MKPILVVCPNPAIDIFAWVDDFQIGAPNRITREKRYPGGKGLHVAMALSELGHDVTVAGFWGGETGTWIKNECHKFYPNIEFIGPELSEWSRSCYTFKSNSAFDDTEILGTGPNITSSDYQLLLNAIDLELADFAMIVLSGSWPKGAPEDGYSEIIKLGKSQNIPSFIDCTGKQLAFALAARPYGAHLNRKEIEEFYEADYHSAQHQLLKNCEIIAVTDGSKGLTLSTKQASYHALARIEKVVSTIGAGDCLTAGVVSGLVQKLSLPDVARMGAACGAANCLREDLGMLYRSDVVNLMHQQLA